MKLEPSVSRGLKPGFDEDAIQDSAKIVDLEWSAWKSSQHLIQKSVPIEIAISVCNFTECPKTSRNNLILNEGPLENESSVWEIEGC